MPYDENGVKWSCEPCIRGHRSSKCAHFDRLMVSVGKAGRPLSKCPHVEGNCNCKKLCAFMVAIPKGTGCVCRPVYKMLLDENGPTPAVSRFPTDLTTSPGPSPNKIQKIGKKHVKPAPEQLERALNTIPEFQQPAAQNGPPAMSSYVQQAPTNSYSYNSTHGAPQPSSVFPNRTGVPNGHLENVFSSGACPSTAPPLTQRDTPALVEARASCCSNSGRESSTDIKEESSAFVQNGFSTSHLVTSPLVKTPSAWQGLPSLDGHYSHVHGRSNGFQPIFPQFASESLPKEYTSLHSTTLEKLTSSQPTPVDTTDFPHHPPPTNRHVASRSCNCGPKCNCFACPDHPYNDVTVQHVQEMGRIIAQDSQVFEDNGTYQNRQSNGIHANPPETKQSVVEPQCLLTNGLDPMTTGNCYSIDDGAFDSDNDPHTLDSLAADHLMVPDAYYTYEYQIGLPGACAGEAGNCQCGPSCSCLGCLTHGNTQ
ncbi:putative copper-activated transcription factor GRISEA [Aspergillus lucknowensis]|uniref:Copper-fist domain-containing protein n=1 Tax=Aspergillus lucknowensis TaxID=176173 RepID=A0ABR4LXP0_9EURO